MCKVPFRLFICMSVCLCMPAHLGTWAVRIGLAGGWKSGHQKCKSLCKALRFWDSRSTDTMQTSPRISLREQALSGNMLLPWILGRKQMWEVSEDTKGLRNRMRWLPRHRRGGLHPLGYAATKTFLSFSSAGAFLPDMTRYTSICCLFCKLWETEGLCCISCCYLQSLPVWNISILFTEHLGIRTMQQMA